MQQGDGVNTEWDERSGIRRRKRDCKNEDI
jgi:hypothetical protein